MSNFPSAIVTIVDAPPEGYAPITGTSAVTTITSTGSFWIAGLEVTVRTGSQVISSWVDTLLRTRRVSYNAGSYTITAPRGFVVWGTVSLVVSPETFSDEWAFAPSAGRLSTPTLSPGFSNLILTGVPSTLHLNDDYWLNTINSGSNLTPPTIGLGLPGGWMPTDQFGLKAPIVTDVTGSKTVDVSCVDVAYGGANPASTLPTAAFSAGTFALPAGVQTFTIPTVAAPYFLVSWGLTSGGPQIFERQQFCFGVPGRRIAAFMVGARLQSGAAVIANTTGASTVVIEGYCAPDQFTSSTTTLSSQFSFNVIGVNSVSPVQMLPNIANYPNFRRTMRPYSEP